MNKQTITSSVSEHDLPRRPIRVLPGTLTGTILPPPSKSIFHRAAICAALTGRADWQEQIHGLEAPFSEDMLATLSGLNQFLAVLGGKESVCRPLTVDCGESGSTLRFLIPLAAACGIETTFTGHGRLPERPLREFQTIFKDEARLSFSSDRRSLPLTVSGRLKGGVYEVPGHISSQYITGMLLALPLTGVESEIRLTSALASRPYVELTLDVMAAFGVNVQTTETSSGSYGGFFIPAQSRYVMPAGGYTVEADYSQAAFWLVAQFLGHSIHVEGLNKESKQGDRLIVDVLSELAAIRKKEGGNLSVDVTHVPDLVPVMSVAAAAVPGAHVFANCARLRIKESDRLTATIELLASSGVQTQYSEAADELTVYGRLAGTELIGLRPGQKGAPTYGDHRMAMTQTIIGTSSRYGYVVDQPACVAKSWPNFYRDFVSLGGSYQEEQ